jgi:single-stranded-DNA-specific exonuclease
MRWTLKPEPEINQIKTLSTNLGVDSLVAKLLVQRGVTTFEQAKNFFRPSLDQLHDPYLMKDMDKAVARIEKAISSEENILVFGDYDVDGTTAVSLVSSYLKAYYQNIATYIPDRYAEGYGVSRAGIDFADDNDFSLIIALDCGIKSIELVDYAKTKSIDFIICDHHRPGDVLPNAVAVLDPKRDDCSYPFDELCGCGVGFKLIQALGRNRGETIKNWLPYLDLVATAIAADIVPIIGENRILAKFGLEVINNNPREGLKALMNQSKIKNWTITDVVFKIAPKINAAGRIKHGNEAVALLTEFDAEQADIFAKEIEIYNTNRKEFDQKTTLEALEQISKNSEINRFTTVVYDENWSKGVIGIVASRLTETYHRPTVVFTNSGDKMAASARSVPGFDVYNALENCAEYLEQFGGHMYAAGMTLLPQNYENFKIAFEQTVKQSIPPEFLIPEIKIDAEIEFSDISAKLIRILKQFEPFGPQNMTPIFMTKNVIDTEHGKTMGKNNEHLRLFVKPIKNQNSEGISAIGFGLGAKFETTKNRKPFDVVYSISENEWNETTNLQLDIKDLQKS